MTGYKSLSDYKSTHISGCILVINASCMKKVFKLRENAFVDEFLYYHLVH